MGQGLETGIKALEHGAGREQAHLGSGQLDGEGETIKTPAYFGYLGRVSVGQGKPWIRATRPFEEEAHGIRICRSVGIGRTGQSQRRHGVNSLLRQSKEGSASHDDV